MITDKELFRELINGINSNKGEAYLERLMELGLRNRLQVMYNTSFDQKYGFNFYINIFLNKELWYKVDNYNLLYENYNTGHIEERFDIIPFLQKNSKLCRENKFHTSNCTDQNWDIFKD